MKTTGAVEFSEKRRRFVLPATAAALLACCPSQPIAAEPAERVTRRFAQWEQAIEEFERQDAAQPPAAAGVVFVGSSSIRMWDLLKSFDLDPPPVNRGFGGSQIVDALHFVDQLVLKHKPRAIVFYSGDNDLASGKPATEVSGDFARFCRVVHETLPEATIIFISIKPSPSRWHLAEAMQAANAQIRELCEADERLEFADVWPAMLDSDGQPREELFAADKLHLNDEGYRLWTEMIRPLLDP